MTDASEKRLARAKKAAACLTADQSRKWLSREIQSYGGDMYMTTLHILEGTPPKAYIVENADRGICTVLDREGRIFGEARGGDYSETVRWVPHTKRKQS